MRITLISARSLCLFVISFIGFGQASAQDLTDNTVKKNISAIDSPLMALNRLQPMAFEYNTSQYSHLKLPAGRHYGFMAEDFQQVFPTLVHKKPYSFMSGKNSYKTATLKSIDMESLIPLLVASIKEQQSQIDQLKAELDALKKNR